MVRTHQTLSSASPRKNFAARLSRDLFRHWAAYLMFLPVLLWYILFRYVPMKNIVIAFMDYNAFKGIEGSKWVGLLHFSKFFSMDNCWRLIRNTLVLNAYSVMFTFPAAIILAVMINEVHTTRMKRLVQTVSYMPHFISMVVVCGIIREFCSSQGLINSVRMLFGASERFNLLSDPALYRTIHIASDTWQDMGWSSIIYLATLSTADPALYEAAYLEGAGRLRRIWHVAVPVLVPIITVQLIMRLGYMMSSGFEKIVLLYNGLTYETADTISTYLYRYGLLNAKYSFGTAVGLFNSACNIILLVAVNFAARRFTGKSLW